MYIRRTLKELNFWAAWNFFNYAPLAVFQSIEFAEKTQRPNLRPTEVIIPFGNSHAW